MSKHTYSEVPVVGISANLGAHAENTLCDIAVMGITAVHDLEKLEHELRTREFTVTKKTRSGDAATMTVTLGGDRLIDHGVIESIKDAVTEAKMLANF